MLDFTQNLPGPYATMILRGLGAEVIKIEPPRGDVARTFTRLFSIVNAGKKSVVLDLKSEETRPQLDALLASADVLVEGFRPGVMGRFGAAADEALEKNPRLVYCSISGFGQEGPYHEDPGHDLNFQALTGVCHMMRDADDRPLGAALPIADLSAALTAATSTLAALYEREKTGKGRAIDVAMVDPLLSWAYVWAEGLTPSDARLSAAVEPTQSVLMKAAAGLPTALGSLLERAAAGLGSDAVKEKVDAVGERLKASRRYQQITRLRLHALPHYAVYKTKDDRWLSIGIVDEDKFWRALCSALGLGGVGALPMIGRFVASTPLRRLIASAIAKRDLWQWLEDLDRAAIPVAPVLTIEEALADPHLMGRRLDTVRGPWPLMGPIDDHVPELGEHTEEILTSST